MLRILIWSNLIYVTVMDVIMIYRVSVMFGQQQRTKQILMLLYSIVTVNTIVFSIVWYGPHSGLVVTNASVYGVTIYTGRGGRS
ncbi:hypothetical protein EV363DRAFT_1351278, partial [Boletus edulis]